jgi:hypothetical protein
MRNLPGADAVASSVSTATKAFQGFAAELQKMSKDSLDHTTQTLEKLRGAKTVEEVVSIQTTYMQQSFASYADHTRRFSELMMRLPMEFARHGRTAFQEGAEAAKKVGEQASEQFQHHQG